MKMREEIDALSTMGLDPVEVLMLPRIIALVCALPILSFIGSMAALYGGGLVAWFYGGMGPAIFIARLHEAVSVTHFEVGIIKAPFMALVIGIVACSEGLRVKGSAEVARQADHDFGGEVDLPGHRARRAVCGVLCIDRNVAMQEAAGQFAIRVRDLVVGFRRHVVIDHLSLDVRRGEILGLVGASGGGKSVLMRTIIGLIPRQERRDRGDGLADRRQPRPRPREAPPADGASCSSRARCSPRSPRGRTFSFRCAKISCCRTR